MKNPVFVVRFGTYTDIERFEFTDPEEAVACFESLCENLMDKNIKISLERVGENVGEKRP